jgi:hypothetical protein
MRREYQVLRVNCCTYWALVPSLDGSNSVMSIPPSLTGTVIPDNERNDADWIDHFRYLLSHHALRVPRLPTLGVQT